jgi:hypothetical protein
VFAVEPLDHRLFELYDEVSATEPPEQNEVGPPEVITGAAGTGFTVTTVEGDAGEIQLFPSVTTT